MAADLLDAGDRDSLTHNARVDRAKRIHCEQADRRMPNVLGTHGILFNDQ